MRPRPDGYGKKEVDGSYSVVRVQVNNTVVEITEEAAVAYVGAAILGLPLKHLICPHCNEAHLDLGRFALDPHSKHLCLCCNREFEDTERAVGNPIVLAKLLLNDPTVSRPMRMVQRKPLQIDQSDPIFSGGVKLWGTHSAILWTAERAEEDGVHVHAYETGSKVAAPDETYGRVIIEGVELNPRAVRSFMVLQQSELHRDKLELVRCDACGRAVVEDKAPKAITPSTEHSCECGHIVRSAQPVIANEMPAVVARLYESAKFSGLKPNGT
jgi:hypothetical protein